MNGENEQKPQDVMTETEAKEKFKKHDWDKLRAEYTQDEARPSLRDIASKHGINSWQVCQRAKDEKWVELRTKYWREVEEELREKAKQQAIKTRFERINMVQWCIKTICEQIKEGTIKGSFRDLELLIRLEADLAGDPVGSQKELKTRVRILWGNEKDEAEEGLKQDVDVQHAEGTNDKV